MTDKVHDKSCCNSLLKYCGVLKKKKSTCAGNFWCIILKFVGLEVEVVV